MTTNAQHTPGKWFVETEADVDEAEVPNVYVCHANTVCDATVICTIGTHEKDRDEMPLEGRLAIARLIAAAPDHASIGWAMCVAGGRWEPWGDGRGEFCLNGIRHSTRLDQFGVPEMTDALRAAILKATGEPK